jgi:hypothetical protein
MIFSSDHLMSFPVLFDWSNEEKAKQSVTSQCGSQPHEVYGMGADRIEQRWE